MPALRAIELAGSGIDALVLEAAEFGAAPARAAAAASAAGQHRQLHGEVSPTNHSGFPLSNGSAASALPAVALTIASVTISRRASHHNA